MTPDELRSVALALDLLDQLAGKLLESARDGIAMNAETVTVTLELDGERWGDEEFLTKALEWLEGTPCSATYVRMRTNWRRHENRHHDIHLRPMWRVRDAPWRARTVAEFLDGLGRRRSAGRAAVHTLHGHDL